MKRIGLGEALKVQCVSCPFRDDNRAEFAVVVNRLRKLARMRQVLPHSKVVQETRTAVRMDVAMIGTGQFACHCTVYDESMKVRPRNEHRQCPGAVEYLKRWELLKNRRAA